jgi:hypothetical protein
MNKFISPIRQSLEMKPRKEVRLNGKQIFKLRGNFKIEMKKKNCENSISYIFLNIDWNSDKPFPFPAVTAKCLPPSLISK